ncbi:hypothetical protein GCM10010441_56470 [Kitasatospora paracochleata]|uniref:LPXTG-motif cell wall-anchored protein n=1 Tax=Kitasatospora paracochleata TaxID=58354 RepID=A0ABT1J7N7_9ACTN|nr:hypothetical protein [Kitasatospora paracochleata]MCP2313123.1 hypothetical protein [Kitasatospora paracochleata]
MRAPAISRFVATSAAAVVLGIGLPLLSGTGTAWACGDEQNTSVEALPEQHATRPVIAFIAPTPGSMTAGGKVEIGLEVVNTTGQAYQRFAPTLDFYDVGGPTNISDLSLEVMKDGQWIPLKLRPGCDPTRIGDTSPLAAPLADGATRRYLFRFGVTDRLETAITMRVYGGLSGNGQVPTFDMAVKPSKPAEQPTSRPTASTAPTTPAPAVPAAVTTTAAAAPAATATATASTEPAAAPQQELASTGPSSVTGFLFASALASLALGGGVLYGVRRITKG